LVIFGQPRVTAFDGKVDYQLKNFFIRCHQLNAKFVAVVVPAG